MGNSRGKWNTDLMSNKQFFRLFLWSVFKPHKYLKFKAYCEDGLIGRFAFEKVQKETTSPIQ